MNTQTNSLTEAALVLQVLVGWLVGLPLLFAAMAGTIVWEKTLSFFIGGPGRPAGRGLTPVTT